MNATPIFRDARGRKYKEPPKDPKRLKINEWTPRRAFLGGVLFVLGCGVVMAAVTQIELTTQVKGVLPVANGGSGLATQTANAIYKGNGASAPVVSALSDPGTIVKSTEPFDVGSNYYAVEIANAGTTGTTNNLLAKLTGAPSTALIAGTGDTDGEVGVVQSGGGTTGNAIIATHGIASCVADNATTAGDFVGIGTSTAGRCKDVTATRPTTGQILGVWLTTTSSAGTGTVLLIPDIIGISTTAINFNNAETPTGSINGSNTSFTLANTPSAGSLQLYKNGQLQIAGGSADYTLATNTITYNAAPITGDTLIAYYRH
jgi:hypothetical protein